MIKPRTFLALLLLLVSAARSWSAELTVQAASSLTDAVKEIAAAYQKQSGDKVLFNFGASSFLVRQIQEGAPADLFLSADEAKMDTLEKEGLLVPGTRRSLLGNSLVIVVPNDSTLKIAGPADLVSNPAVKKIAVAQPDSVPVGVYTKEYLTKLGLWDKVLPKVIPTANVRAALAVVESGDVDAGFVYKTDMLISKKVKAALEIPAQEAPPISYPIALLAHSKDMAAARKLLAYFESPAALEVFKKYGFTVAK